MWRYAVTIFLSAFLLFLVQPLIGNFILPWFGGGAGVWTVCMLFFQAALLAGYAYAHVIAMRCSPKVQMILHIFLLLTALAFLPITPSDAHKPVDASQPGFRIFLLLAATLGVPFIALASTAPLLQSWFSRTHIGASPYRLYALSNAGSLLALIAFPFAAEPLLTRYAQTLVWSGGFVIFALLCGYAAVRQASALIVPGASTPRRISEDAESISFARHLMWVALPACAVILLLSITSHLSEEIAPVPFLWVVALAAYLLTFIFCFEWPWLYHRGVFLACVLTAPYVLWAMMQQDHVPLGAQIAINISILFCCCMVCHGELYRIKPSPRRLTRYYLLIASGGALGGLFVSAIATNYFDRNLELYVGVYGAIALLIASMTMFSAKKPHRLAILGMILIAMVAGFLVRTRTTELEHNVKARARNFYGTLELRVDAAKIEGLEYRRLMHGRIEHGAQHFHPTQPEFRVIPTTYYGLESGLGIVLANFRTERPRRVGIVGMGTAGNAIYARRGELFRFYEINPKVREFAEQYFSYISDAQQRGVDVEVAMGDARLVLEQESPQQFDVLVLDAFSGDAIPVHLLTHEAFEIYRKHLATDGVILVHISNKYLDLRPVVQARANQVGWKAIIVHTPEDKQKLLSEAMWVLLTANQSLLDLPPIQQAGQPFTSNEIVNWTDDRHSLLPVLKQLPSFGPDRRGLAADR